MANPPPATLYRDPLATLSSTAAQVPLSEERAADGKSLLNPPRDDNRLSEWYESYPEEFEESNNAFECVILDARLKSPGGSSVPQSHLVLTRHTTLQLPRLLCFRRADRTCSKVARADPSRIPRDEGLPVLGQTCGVSSAPSVSPPHA
jgi:hypothetical protein